MTQKELIRQEIERQRSFIEGLFIEGDNNFYDGQDDAYNHLLSFIDSLPEETCKDSLQVPETCKENTDSFTSLEEAAEEYAYKGIPEELKSGVKPIAEQIIKNFIAGAKWQKKQMTKDAVECEVADLNGEIYNNCIEKGMTDEDKVKIIIIKGND